MFYEEMIQQIVDIVRVLVLQLLKWLDVGCRTGKMARTALHNFDIQKMVYIDVEEEMLEKTERFCDDGKEEFWQCDVRKVAYQEMFDIVTAVQVNHYFKKEERIATIKNCHDAFKENGVFISFENFAPSSGDGTKLFLKRWKQFQITNGKTVEEADLHIKHYEKKRFSCIDFRIHPAFEEFRFSHGGDFVGVLFAGKNISNEIEDKY